MTDPAKHYHRIETAEMGLNIRPDAEYLLTRLRGQLERLNSLTQPGDPVHLSEIRDAISQARSFGDQLSTVMGGKHYDVI